MQKHSTAVVPFAFDDHLVRAISVDDTPMLHARDAAVALGYANPSEAYQAHCKHLKRFSYREMLELGFAAPNPRGEYFIPESDVYRLVMRSKLEDAERFQDWVVEEVLPSIRKTGSYAINPQAKLQAGPSLKDQLAFAREVSKALRYSDTSKIRMYRILAEESGITTRILPDYTDEPLTRSLSDLLKLHGSDLSAVKANKLLVAAGYLAEIERPSRGGPKKFKSITEAGSRFGKNETSPENPNETQPRWFVNTAQELMGILDQERVRMEAA